MVHAINSYWVYWTILGSSLFFVGLKAQAACPDVRGTLTGLEHDIAGSVTIDAECVLKATEFSYDGAAPSVYWWGAPSCDVATIKKQGRRISNQQVEEKYNNAQVTVPLLPDIDWANIGCISVYCEEFYADLGHIQVEKSLAVPSPPAPKESSKDPSPSPSLESPPTAKSPRPRQPPPQPLVESYESLDDLSSCKELIPGYFNLYWSLSGDKETIFLGFEGRTGGDNTWVGFGFSPPGAAGPEMVGSNVVVAGMVGGECFASNYFLSSQSQCNFENAEGVCPSFAGTFPLIPSTSVELLNCEKNGDKLSFIVSRPLEDSDNKPNAWPVENASQFSLYAMGPVSEGSNATVPVVLYHNLQLPGTPTAQSVSANPSNPLIIDFIKAGKNCRAIASMREEVPGGDAPSSAPTPVATIDGPVDFTLTIGSNFNYPNPPAWGYSLWVNGEESPVLVLRRGTTYTFSAEAGPTHPVYITNSIIGGGLLVDFADETVFAGNDTTFGTTAMPATFTWTPDSNTPDTVYYQCLVHQKLGWMIKVLDAGSPTTTPTPTASSTSISADNNGSNGAAAKCTISIGGIPTTYDACFQVKGIGKDYNIAWSLENDPTDSAMSLLRMAMNATIATDGYVAMGFPLRPGVMVGASAMVLKTCSSCESGANITEYLLAGQVTNAVKSGGVLEPTELEAAADDEGVVSGRFTVKVPRQTARRRRSLAQTSALNAPLSSFPLLYASGQLSSSGNLLQHNLYGSSAVDLSATMTDSSDPQPSSISVATVNSTARTAHMWLMTIGFGVLIPLGVLAMRWWPVPQHSAGFKLHRVLQSGGFLVGCGGLAAGFVASGGWSTPYEAHRNIGIAVIVLSFLQVMAVVWRPAPGDKKLRRPWALGHRWMGRATALLAIANIYYGMIHVAQLGTWAWATYTAILGGIVLLAVGREVIGHGGRDGKGQKDPEESETLNEKAGIENI